MVLVPDGQSTTGWAPFGHCRDRDDLTLPWAEDVGKGQKAARSMQTRAWVRGDGQCHGPSGSLAFMASSKVQGYGAVNPGPTTMKKEPES